MADFEAKQPPYDHWTEDERKNRLNTLLTIIGGLTGIVTASLMSCGKTKRLRLYMSDALTT
jgi:hypothetical protein